MILTITVSCCRLSHLRHSGWRRFRLLDNAALVYLALPVNPLVIVSMVIVAMMRFINISRKKDILLIVGHRRPCDGIRLSVLTQRAQNGNVSAQQMRSSSLARQPAPQNRIQFPSASGRQKPSPGLFSGGLLNLAVFLAASLIVSAGMMVLAEKLFYRGVIGLNESSGRRRRLTRDEMSRRVSSGRRAIYAIFMREFRIMNRTPFSC